MAKKVTLAQLLGSLGKWTKADARRAKALSGAETVRLLDSILDGAPGRFGAPGAKAPRILRDYATMIHAAARRHRDIFVGHLRKRKRLRTCFDVVVALSLLRGEDVDELLFQAANCGDAMTEWVAISGLGRHRVARAAAFLTGRLRDRDSMIRSAAVDALQKVGGPEALKPLAAVARNPREFSGTKASAKKAIAAIRARSHR